MRKNYQKLNEKNQGSSLFLTLSFWGTVVGIVLFLALGWVVFKGTGAGNSKDILLPRGASLHKVSQVLAENQIISNPFAFKILLRMTSGSSRVRAGEFRFVEGSSLWQAMRTLYYSEPVLHTVTIPEGWTAKQISEILAKENLIHPEKFLRLALSPAGAKKYNLKTPHLEGFLYPETYAFSKVDGEEKILDQMVQQFFTYYNRDLKQDAERLGYTVERLVTLASIVEKETGQASERPLVASVFHNRLKKRMRLQSDPTTIYGIPNFNGNLTKAHLQTHTPYNTYMIPGLPIGPIANPGLASLKATLFPAETEFLYFVSNNNGSHIFSKTYGEHNRHVNSYQPALPKRKSQAPAPHAKRR